MALNPSDFLLKFLGTSVILLAEVIRCDTSGLGRNSSHRSLTKKNAVLVYFMATTIHL